MGEVMAGYRKGFWVLVVGVLIGGAMLLHMEQSRARTAETFLFMKKTQPIVVEALKPSEIRSLIITRRK